MAIRGHPRKESRLELLIMALLAGLVLFMAVPNFSLFDSGSKKSYSNFYNSITQAPESREQLLENFQASSAPNRSPYRH